MADNEDTRARFSIPDKAFAALVRDIIKDKHPDIDRASLGTEFFKALQEVAERPLIRMFQGMLVSTGC